MLIKYQVNVTFFYNITIWRKSIVIEIERDCMGFSLRGIIKVAKVARTYIC